MYDLYFGMLTFSVCMYYICFRIIYTFIIIVYKILSYYSYINYINTIQQTHTPKP